MSDVTMPILDKSSKSIHQGGLPFWRYSKFCLLEWAAAMALIVYGFAKDKQLLPFGFAALFGFPLLNEVVLNLAAFF